MNVEVRGKNGFTITPSIENYATEKLQKIDHYFNQNLNAQVLCKVYNDNHKVEVTLPTKLFTMRAEVTHEDMYAAIDLMMDKLEAQIRKHKTKINKSLQKREGVKELFKESSDVDLKALEKELVISLAKVKSITLEEMTHEEAITALELLDHDFYVFKDINTHHVSIAYLRKDGQYGIIETE
jgi:putative sigma-54 modulation protein